MHDSYNCSYAAFPECIQELETEEEVEAYLAVQLKCIYLKLPLTLSGCFSNTKFQWIFSITATIVLLWNVDRYHHHYYSSRRNSSRAI